ncbi:MAG: hypothetical protein C5B51_12140 [Terriglobia bacterium]|nr:MAG: hypothetical protein C5B51_12140 [Terriglobia bacterium]
MEGRRIGAYQIQREIGHGGLGRVYLASRDDDILSRFRQERDILASLDHPAIARRIDGGSTEEGLPYFVMDYIDGEPIDTWCDRERSLDEHPLEASGFRKVRAEPGRGGSFHSDRMHVVDRFSRQGDALL